MKIVFPVLSLEIGGARFIYQLADALLDKGHNVEVVIPHRGELAWPIRSKVTRVEELSPSSIPEGDFILPNFYLTVKPAWESKKGRVVRLSLGYEPLWVKDSEIAKQTYLIDAPIMTISQWHRQLILGNLGLDSTVISAGIDTQVFHPQPKLSEITGRKNIFYIMRSKAHGYTWKGGEDFLEACTRLKKDLPEFDLMTVIPEGLPFESPVPCSVISARSDFELSSLYARSDLFVYTSYFEAFGMPPLEAMACGTAVITTDCGGSRDYAIHDHNCLVVSPSDINQLTSSMYELLTNDTKRQNIAANGHKYAQDWTWQRTADQVEAFLFTLR